MESGRGGAMNSSPLGWWAVSALLVETASRDLSGIDGSFGLTSGEWSVACFVAGVITAAIGAAVAFFMKDKS